MRYVELDTIWYAASFGSVLILITFICILSIKLQRSHFADNYGIQEEMSRSVHIIILLFITCTVLYFVFYDDNVRQWTITIVMSIACTSLTIISTGGVIHIQDRQDRVYRMIQRKFYRFNDHGSGESGHSGNTPKQQNESPPTEKSRQANKSFLEQKLNDEPQYAPLKRDRLDELIHSRDSRQSNDALYVIPLNKSPKQMNPNGSPSDQIGNKSVASDGGVGANNEKLSVLTDSHSPRSHRDWKARSKRSISRSIIEADAKGSLELAQVITNPKLLNVFAQFLCVEFSCENLLFIIEIVQFKRYIKENDNDCSSILGEYLSIPEHADLPKFEYNMNEEKSITMNEHDQNQNGSYHLHSNLTGGPSSDHDTPDKENNTLIDVYMYGLYIVNKYIRIGGSHQINIPGRVRNQIISQANDGSCIRELDKEKLQTLFDDAFIEILALLQDPLSRFSSWEEFNSYLKAIAPSAYPFFPGCKEICSCCCRSQCCCCCCCRCYQNDDSIESLIKSD